MLYLWGLGSSGWANSYYAAAAQAGTQDWKAWLFGSLDAGNAITVDKPPAAMWVMALSGRLFGFNAFTMLLPQALMGVAAVAVLYFTVKRCSGPGAGLVAGAVLALTPVATLMFRYNNPDALLVLLLVVAAYCTVRAIETGGVRWMALTGCVVGFAFLTKMLQAFLIVPGLALAFLVAAPIGMWKRIGALAGRRCHHDRVGRLVRRAGQPVARRSRPYIAGSTDNSLLQLALGYNGIERIVGRDGGGGHGPGGGPGGPGGGNLFFGGEPGIGRMFGPSFGTEASWLLPAAIIGLVAGLWLTWRTARTGKVRASLLLWGGWLLVTGAVFSFMDGTVHPYYTVELAPAIAALVGISVAELLRRKESLVPRLVLSAMLAVTGVWAFVLLNRTPDWLPALRWVVLVGSIVVAVAIGLRAHRLGRATVVVAVAAAVFGLGATVGLFDRQHLARAQRPDGDLRSREGGLRRWTGRRSRRSWRTVRPWRRQRRAPSAGEGRRQSLGGSVGRLVHGQRSGAQDGSVADGRSVVSPVGIRRRPSRSSSSTSPTARCGTSSPMTAAAMADRVGIAPAPPTTSPPGSSSTSPRRTSAVPPCTTCNRRYDEEVTLVGICPILSVGEGVAFN